MEELAGVAASKKTSVRSRCKIQCLLFGMKLRQKESRQELNRSRLDSSNTICITDKIAWFRRKMEEPVSNCDYDYQQQPPVDLQELLVHQPRHQGLVHSLCVDMSPKKNLEDIQSKNAFTCDSDTWCSLPRMQTGQTRAAPSSSSSGSSSGNRAWRHSSTGVNIKQESDSIGSQSIYGPWRIFGKVQKKGSEIQVLAFASWKQLLS